MVDEAAGTQLKPQTIETVADDIAGDGSAGDRQRVGASAKDDVADQGARRDDGRVAIVLVDAVAVGITITKGDARGGAVDDNAGADRYRTRGTTGSRRSDSRPNSRTACDGATGDTDRKASGRVSCLGEDAIGVVTAGCNRATGHFDRSAASLRYA